MAEWVAEVHGESHSDDFEAIVEYILQATKDHDLMRNIYQYVAEKKKDDTMSVADWLRADGKAEGRAEGRAEGKAEGEARMLSRLLAQRFGKLPAGTRAHLRGAAIPDLERWASRLFTATSLDEVFAEP